MKGVQDPREAVARCVERCAARAWRLAAALAADPAEAQDLVQQACLVLARKADRVAAADDPWPFFAGVLAHEARNARRKRRPVPHDEPHLVDPVDARAVDPARAAAQAEDRARAEAALAELPSAQREALLLTHLGGLTQAEAAAQLDLPLKTLGSHVKRGLDRLRERLGAPSDAAAATSLALVGLPAPPGGLEAATAAWREAALAALGPATKAGVGAAIGGVVTVKQSSVIVVGVLSLLAGLAGGVVLDRAALAPDGPAPRADTAGTASRAPASPAPSRHTEASRPTAAPTPVVLEPPAPGDPLPLVNDDVVRERDALRARVAALEAELAPIHAARAARRPVFTFGKSGAESFIADADWPDLARAHRTMTAALAEVQGAKRRGEKPAEDALLRLQESTERIRRFEFAANGRLGSVAEQNGETTHPLTIANLIAALLADSGRPLAPAQVQTIEALGAAYERELGAAHAARPDDAPRAALLLDEYVAKDRFRDGVLDTLDPDQRSLVIAAADREVAYRDLWDPTLMLIHTSVLVTGADLQEIAGKLTAILGKRLELDAATQARLGPVLDAWARDVQGALAAPVSPFDVPHFTCEQGRIALEAGVRLYAAIVALLPPGASGQKHALDDAGVPIPRLVRRSE